MKSSLTPEELQDLRTKVSVPVHQEYIPIIGWVIILEKPIIDAIEETVAALGGKYKD